MGAQSERNQKKSLKTVAAARAAMEEMRGWSDAQVAQRGREAANTQGEGKHPVVLASLALAAERTMGLQPFDVQLQGVQRLLAGDVIHMATGEGKTLVGAMAATGFAMSGKRVHVVTVNDYLAARDAQWMRPLVEFFGVSVSHVIDEMDAPQRRHAYACDVVYAPVTEIGFDHLRDNQVTRREDEVQVHADVALVDEADSVLVDEALVPLVLAGSVSAQQSTGEITAAVSHLREGRHYTVDADRRNVFLTDEGAAEIERRLGIDSLYSEDAIGSVLVRVNLALHAQALLTRDVHYLVQDGKVQLIDASRGRVADLQRWPDGLQAAVEAKEGLAVSDGGRILDQITLQALMSRYPTVCGMTGTAVEAVDQLRQFYGLTVSVIEPNVPSQRIDHSDAVYATAQLRNRAVVEEIAQAHAKGQPVLVGTHDVAESEALAAALEKRGISVAVLNAKNDEQEAAIVAEAGKASRVTVSTQMAGRGTDITLGEGVAELGGLKVIGTSRHRSSRLDHQLRGRSGRQGDPGESLFFVSLEDDLITTGSDGAQVSAQPDQAGRIEEKRVHDFIAHCQRVTEGQLLTIHAQTWKYNKLLADQREIIDERRASLLDTDAAWQQLAQAAPERAAELEHLNAETKQQAAREIMLFHLDDEWAEHLAIMDDVRESIHLRAIAKETPIDEFHRIAVREFKDLAQRAVEKSVETFRSVLIDDSGAHLEDAGRSRPSATWTYMVSDNPLSGGGGGALSTFESFIS
ncbi:accessory Sec system translocase SecA2 [Corynebacterium tapiri]